MNGTNVLIDKPGSYSIPVLKIPKTAEEISLLLSAPKTAPTDYSERSTSPIDDLNPKPKRGDQPIVNHELNNMIYGKFSARNGRIFPSLFTSNLEPDTPKTQLVPLQATRPLISKLHIPLSPRDKNTFITEISDSGSPDKLRTPKGTFKFAGLPKDLRTDEIQFKSIHAPPIDIRYTELFENIADKIQLPSRAESEIFRKYFCSEANQEITSRLFWYVFCAFFQPNELENTDEMMNDLSKLTTNFFWLMDKNHRNKFFDSYHIAMSFAIIKALQKHFPGSKKRFSSNFKLRVFELISELITGIRLRRYYLLGKRNKLFPRKKRDILEVLMHKQEKMRPPPSSRRKRTPDTNFMKGFYSSSDEEEDDGIEAEVASMENSKEDIKSFTANLGRDDSSFYTETRPIHHKRTRKHAEDDDSDDDPYYDPYRDDQKLQLQTLLSAAVTHRHMTNDEKASHKHDTYSFDFPGIVPSTNNTPRVKETPRVDNSFQQEMAKKLFKKTQEKLESDDDFSSCTSGDDSDTTVSIMSDQPVKKFRKKEYVQENEPVQQPFTPREKFWSTYTTSPLIRRCVPEPVEMKCAPDVRLIKRDDYQSPYFFCSNMDETKRKKQVYQYERKWVHPLSMEHFQISMHKRRMNHSMQVKNEEEARKDMVWIKNKTEEELNKLKQEKVQILSDKSGTKVGTLCEKLITKNKETQHNEAKYNLAQASSFRGTTLSHYMSDMCEEVEKDFKRVDKIYEKSRVRLKTTKTEDIK
jgi:hypothetical protein